MNGGKMDGFLRAQNDVFSIGYYAEQDLPFTPHVAKAFTTFDRFFCSLLASTLPQPRVHARRPVLRDDGQHAPDRVRRPARLPRHDDLRRAVGQAGVSNRYFYTDIPVSALWGAPGLARSSPVQEYYEQCRHGHAAGAVVRRPGVQRRGPGHLGRRAPARRRPRRPGVHGRRRPRVHGVAAVQARRAVHRLRRVGRLLRPRRAAARPRHPRQLGPQQGLRPDGDPDPGRRGLAVRAARPRRPLDLRLRVDPEDDPLPLRVWRR